MAFSNCLLENKICKMSRLLVLFYHYRSCF
uniref:Uncharacterized protein n=1 Tax=Anguilla anguilla TaxID=7936 RepID=A0A0E9QXL0_ANGAN